MEDSGDSLVCHFVKNYYSERRPFSSFTVQNRGPQVFRIWSASLFQGKNRPLSALFFDLKHGSTLALNSFGNGSRFPVFLPFRLSPDCAMNRGTRPLSLTDGKFSLEKREGVLYSASRDARAVPADTSERKRPALAFNRKSHHD